MFRDIAQIYSEHEFLIRYEDFRRRYPRVAEYLDNSVEVEKWARCYFPGARYNIDTSNCVESLNKVMEEARHYNLLPMIDAIVEKISEWFSKHRKEGVIYANTGRMLVPRVNEILHKRCAEACHLIATELNIYMKEFSVVGRDGKQYMVDLRHLTCSCKTFDIDKYPCAHAISALYRLMREEERGHNIELHELCSPKYYVAEWISMYCKTIYLVPHSSDWNIPASIKEKNILPKKKKNRKGRREVRRKPSVGEPQRKKKGKAVQVVSEVVVQVGDVASGAELAGPSGGGGDEVGFPSGA